jgi:hypothetical protein
MVKYKPVSVSKAAFIFCKSTIAVLLWIAFLFRIKWLIIVTFLLLALSAILKIKRAPLIVLYTYTVNKIFKSKDEVLDEYGMRFSHTFGATINLIALIFLYYINTLIGWGIVFFLAIAKTAGALGFCTGLKLYECMSKGGCCSFLKKK